MNTMIQYCRSPLHAMRWFRIVLDEAHTIKDKACSTAKVITCDYMIIHYNIVYSM